MSYYDAMIKRLNRDCRMSFDDPIGSAIPATRTADSCDVERLIEDLTKATSSYRLHVTLLASVVREAIPLDRRRRRMDEALVRFDALIEDAVADFAGDIRGVL